ncbi:hypothetical protein FACS1894199_02920 [Bacteroidia bacterium]|nr:hypothetical protein FACS1894199_02920 [Bacteroidia bacterium]
MKKTEKMKQQESNSVSPTAMAVSKIEELVMNWTDKDSPFYGQPITTSLLVAKKFGKRSDNVIRDIKNIESKFESLQIALLKIEQRKISPLKIEQRKISPLKIEERNRTAQDIAIENMVAQNYDFSDYFLETTHVDNRGKEYPMYMMNYEGFTLLVGSFTGDKAFKFRVDYMREFNRRGKEIAQLKEQLKDERFGKLLADSVKKMEERNQGIVAKYERALEDREKRLQDREKELQASDERAREYYDETIQKGAELDMMGESFCKIVDEKNKEAEEKQECIDYISHCPSFPCPSYAEGKNNFRSGVALLDNINTLLDSNNLLSPELKAQCEKIKQFLQNGDKSITSEVLAYENENKVYKQKLLNE